MPGSISAFFSYLVLISVCSFVLSCASPLKLAEEKVQAGDLEGAMSDYIALLEKDSENTVAKTGLLRARSLWIDQKLIQVRLLRLGGNLGESEDLLISIIEKENKWRVFPTGQVFATQADELRELENRIRLRIKMVISNNQPFAAQALINKYETLYVHTLKSDNSDLKRQTQKMGRNQCREIGKKMNPLDYYSSRWLVDTCRTLWNMHLKLGDKKNSVTLFGGVHFQFNISGLTPEQSQLLASDLNQSFQRSKWFSKGLKNKLMFDVKGKFHSENRKRNVNLVKKYTIKEAYEEKMIKKKDPEAEPKGLLGLLSLLAGDNKREEDNGDGTVTITQTMYRDVPRTFKYPAIEVQQIKSISLDWEAAFGDRRFMFDYEYGLNEISNSFTANFPEAGVHPRQVAYIGDEEWLKINSRALLNRVENFLAMTWRESFCQPPSKQSVVSTAEHIFRCEYGIGPESYGFVDEYFEKQFGLTPELMRHLL